jgi:hypothetical protein
VAFIRDIDQVLAVAEDDDVAVSETVAALLDARAVRVRSATGHAPTRCAPSCNSTT